MISDQRSESSNGNVEVPARGLTVEESFFLELLQKKEKPVISLKFTQKGAKVGTLEPFSNYYNEAEIIRLLESLVSKKALIKQERGTVLLCPKCGGHANMSILVCPRCGSTKIGRNEDLNHVECEYWGPREEFIDGVLLRCPRCDELLDERAIEGTSGYFSVSDPYFECQDCETAVSKNNLTMVCIKCSNKYTTVQASYLNSVSYTLAQGVSVKPQSEPPKSIQQRMKAKYKSEPVVEKEPAPEAEPELISVEEKTQEIPKDIEKVLVREPEIAEKVEIVQESPEEPKKIQLNVLPEPEVIPETEPEPEIEIRFVPEPEPVREEPVSEEKIETEIEPEPVPKRKKRKKKKSILQNPMNRLSDMLKKKPKNKPEKKKKSIKKTVITNKIKPKPMPRPEPEIEEEEYESIELEEEYSQEPEPVEEEVDPEEEYAPVEDEFESEEEYEPETIEYEEKPVPQNRFYERTPKPMAPAKPESCQILMVVENVTVSEFVIESLERVKKPINVLHIEDGHMALKELKLKYDALILDFELRSIESKFILSEMEKWGIMTPIIVLSDADPKLDKYILNIEAVLKKKQGSINKIGGILRKLL